tara:strand:+ start:19680 stop:20237 length:558 start_codon:yes stop_codon:yes gene_type:complete
MSKKRGSKSRKHKSVHSKTHRKTHKPLLPDLFKKTPGSIYRKKEEADLRHVEEEVGMMEAEKGFKRLIRAGVPTWFYLASIFAAFMFTVYISIFATLHFESIEYMNITIIFLFISMVSFFLISVTYFVSEKKFKHAIPPFIFFAGISTLMIYAFNAVDTSNLVRFSITYTIIVAAISAYVLAIRR